MQIWSVASQNGASAGQATPARHEIAQRSKPALQCSPSSQSRSLRQATQAWRAGWQKAVLLPQSALVRHSTHVIDLLSHQGVAVGHSSAVAQGRAFEAPLMPEAPPCAGHPAEPLQVLPALAGTIASATASPQPGREAATSTRLSVSSASFIITDRALQKGARLRFPTCQRQTGAPSSPRFRC